MNIYYTIELLPEEYEGTSFRQKQAYVPAFRTSLTEKDVIVSWKP